MVVLKRREHFWFRPTIRSIKNSTVWNIFDETTFFFFFFCLLVYWYDNPRVVCTRTKKEREREREREKEHRWVTTPKRARYVFYRTFQCTLCVVISTNNFWYERARNLFDFLVRLGRQRLGTISRKRTFITTFVPRYKNRNGNWWINLFWVGVSVYAYRIDRPSDIWTTFTNTIDCLTFTSKQTNNKHKRRL